MNANPKAMQSETRYTDQTIACIDCGTRFVWTRGEQEFFASKRFTNPPKRCKQCRIRNRDNKR